jgi:sigma-70-like protein
VAKGRVEGDYEDLVRLYLADIGKYTLLTKDDEVRLAKAIEAGDRSARRRRQGRHGGAPA